MGNVSIQINGGFQCSDSDSSSVILNDEHTHLSLHIHVNQTAKRQWKVLCHTTARDIQATSSAKRKYSVSTTITHSSVLRLSSTHILSSSHLQQSPTVETRYIHRAKLTSLRSPPISHLPPVMSREAYAPPTLQPSSSNPNTTTNNTTDVSGPSTPYTCGDCGLDIHLKKGEGIRCGECGHRVLMKKRTNRYVLSSNCVDGRRAILGADELLHVGWCSLRRDEIR